MQFAVEYIPLERRIAFKRDRANERREWIERQHARNPRCHYCQCRTDLKERGHNQRANHHEEQFATLDHATPLAAGGKDWPSNWRMACAVCNSLKADTGEREYMALLKAEGIRD